MDDNKIPVIVRLTILGYELNSIQNAYLNYLIPAVFGCLLYILHFTIDLVLVYRHYYEDEYIWSSLTLFFMYLPVIGCFILTVSSWEMWPDSEGCGWTNTKWFLVKVLQHLFFPIWSMWRYAEKLFWSIEGVICVDEGTREEALNNSVAPRTIEFYFFLRGFMHTIPQILLQLHVLMRNVNTLQKQTVDLQAASILINIAIMAATTVLYQRFKTQKVGGKNYPWFKPYKYTYDSDVVDSCTPKRKVGFVYCTKDSLRRVEMEIENQEAIQEVIQEVASKTSSEYYLEPRDSAVYSFPSNDSDSLTKTFEDEVDFPRPIRFITSLPEDDLVGKVIAFFWWFCFLIARFLAISAFAYFFPKDIIWLLSSHFILCVAFLLYDVQAHLVRKTKAVFFIFIGLIYLFCIIEFKKQFKKAKFIYNGFFVLMFTENFVMCMIWWFSKLETIYNDWWFQFIFYVVILCTFLSFSSMVFYNIISKPEKIVVGKEVVVSIIYFTTLYFKE